MAKINLKQDEIKKLEDTHKELTKDALKQAQSGASMKKVNHNLKIAKTVAKRVEDLKQQVQSDKQQLQSVSNADKVDQNLPFKKVIEQSQAAAEVKHIPSVQDSSTGSRHSPDILGMLVGTKEKNMNVKKKHSKKY